MTDDELVDRTVAIIHSLSDLKEDILENRYGIQPDFDAGMLEAAMAILSANIPDDDPRVKAENLRQCNARLLRAINRGDFK